jgi:hypothetical protein
MQEDKGVVLAAVTQNGFALQFAAPAMQADKDVVLAAMAQNVAALLFAAPALKESREFVLAAVADEEKDRCALLAPVVGVYELCIIEDNGGWGREESSWRLEIFTNGLYKLNQDSVSRGPDYGGSSREENIGKVLFVRPGSTLQLDLVGYRYRTSKEMLGDARTSIEATTKSVEFSGGSIKIGRLTLNPKN